jgi:tetratricopeptide (TPR) repeat protein
MISFTEVAMVRRIAVGLLAALLAGAGAGAAMDATLAELLRRARESTARGDLADAGRALRAAVQASPQSTEAHRALGDLYLRTKETQAALQEYQEALSLDASDADSRTKVAGIYLAGRRYEDAATQAEQASKLAPERSEPLAVLARAQAALGKPEEAVTTLAKAVERAPGDEALRVELASLHVARKTPAEAERVLRAGLAATPSSRTLRAALANLLAGQRRFAESDALVDEVVKLSAEDPRTLRQAGLYRLRRGDAPGAEALLRRAVGLAGQDGAERALALADLADLCAITGRLAEARQALEESQKLAPGDPLILLRLANFYLLTDAPDRAEPWIERLRATDADNPNVRLLQARLDLARGRVDEARQALEGMTESAPDSTTVHLYLGKAYAVGRQWDKAEAAYRKVLEEVPGHFFANLDLAKVYLGTGRAAEALEPLGRVLAATPDFAPAHLLRADALLATGKALEAEGEYRALLGSKAPAEPAALHARLAAALEAQGRLSDALDHYAESHRLVPAGAEAALRGVALLDRVGKREQADRVSREYLDAGGDSPQGLTALAGRAMERRDTDLAHRLLAKALAADPGSAPARELEARLHLAEGDRAQAEASLRAALASEPKRASALVLLATVLEGQGKKAEATEVYERVLRWSPDNALAANNLAFLYLDDEAKLPEALRLALLAVEKAPANPFTLDTLGWVRYRLQDYAAALGPLEEAHRLQPSHPEIAFHLGMAYAKAGRPQEARPLLEEALKAADGAPWVQEAGRALDRLGGADRTGGGAERGGGDVR